MVPDEVAEAAPEEEEVDPDAAEAAEEVDPDAAEAAEEVAFIVKESKAGYKTTEFWVTVITSLAVVFNGIPAPESKEGYIAAALAAIYAVSRGLAKNKIPNTETEVKV